MASIVSQEQAYKNHTESFEPQGYRTLMAQDLPVGNDNIGPDGSALDNNTSNSDLMHGPFSSARMSSPRITSDTSHLGAERDGDPNSGQASDKQLSRRSSLPVNSINNLLHDSPSRADENRPVAEPRVLCPNCDEWIVTHDLDGNTTDRWEEHSLFCQSKRAMRDASPSIIGDNSASIISDTPAPTADSSEPKDTNTAFRRRKVKHYESERLALLERDTQIDEIEEYRVLCAFCDKWIQLRKDRPYCPIAWTAHKLQCVNRPRKFGPKPVPVTKKVKHETMSADPPDASSASVQLRRTEDERVKFLVADPNATTVEPHRILCAICRRWIQLRKNSTYCTAPWVQHVKKCQAKHVVPRRLGRFAAPYVPDQTPYTLDQDGEDELESEEDDTAQAEVPQEDIPAKRGRGRPRKRKQVPTKGGQPASYALRPVSGTHANFSNAQRGSGRSSISPPRLRTPSPLPNHPYSNDMYWYPTLPPMSSYYSLYAGSQYNENDDSYSLYFHAQPPAHHAGATAGQNRFRGKLPKARNAKAPSGSGVSHGVSPKTLPSDPSHVAHLSPGPDSSHSGRAWIVWRLKDYSANSCPMDPSPAPDTHSSSMLRAGSEVSGSSSEHLPMYRSGTWPHLLDPQEPNQTHSLSPYVHPEPTANSKDTPIAPGTHSARFAHSSPQLPSEDPGIINFNSSAHIPIRTSETYRPPPPQSPPPPPPRPQVAPDPNIDPRFSADPRPSHPQTPIRASEAYRPPLPPHSPLPPRAKVVQDLSNDARYSADLRPGHSSMSRAHEAYRPPPPQSPLPPRHKAVLDPSIDPRFSAALHPVPTPIPIRGSEAFRSPQSPLLPGPPVAPESIVNPRFPAEQRPAHNPKEPEPPKGIDLDSPERRLAYTFQSIAYLFRTSYQGADDMSLDTLTTFMNRCIPPDKMYDGHEVGGHVAILGERKQLMFTKEGGVQLLMPPP